MIPLFVIPTRKVGKVRWDIAGKSQEKKAELNDIIQETMGISGSTLMKIFTTEAREEEKFRDVNGDVIDLQVKETLAGRWFIMQVLSQNIAKVLRERGLDLRQKVAFLAQTMAWFQPELVVSVISVISLLSWHATGSHLFEVLGTAMA